MYEGYEVRSRVLGWDKKWLLIGSWFLKKRKGKNGEEVVLASTLSKYVVKKGRFTVAPERMFRAAGLLPDRVGEDVEEGKEAEVGSGSGSGSETPEDRVDTTTADIAESAVLVHAAPESPPLPSPSPSTPNNQDQNQEGLQSVGVPTIAVPDALQPIITMDATTTEQSTTTAPVTPQDGEWDWARIEKERLRGLDLVREWMQLDGELVGEFERRPF